MRAISIRCPTCNASLQVASDATATTCEYCHTPCRIQARTGFLQRPTPPSGPPEMPVAQAPANHVALLVAVGALMALLGTSAAAYLLMRSSAQTAAREAAAPRPAVAPVAPVAPVTQEAPRPAMRWGGSPALLRDLDRDGDEDLIGMVDQYLDGKRYLAAYSGLTGQELWRSPAITASATYQPRLALTEAHVLHATDEGELRSYALSTGAPGWVATLGEKVERLCATSPTQVRVITADEQARTLELADGTLGEPMRWRAREGACEELPLAWHRYGMTVRSGYGLARVPGMQVRLLARRGEATLAAGGKSPGTAVPMLARLAGKEVLWKVELPSESPLAAQMREDLIAFDEDLVTATYKTTSGTNELTRLVALAFADGARRWEVPSSECRTALTRRMVICINWSQVTAYHRASGQEAFRLGE